MKLYNISYKGLLGVIMTIIDLKYFQAVATYKSISRAAEYLHISQPSLSVAIKGLEDEFGVTLFERRHKGVVLSAEGEILFGMSKELVSGFDGICEAMHDLGGKRKSLRIGVPPMIGSLILPHICGEFVDGHRDIRLDISEGGSRELLSRLNDGLLDMLFLTHREGLGTELSSLEVSSLEVVCCASFGSDIAGRDRIDVRELDGVPLVLFKNSFFQTEIIKKLFSDCGIEPNILLQTDQLSTVESIVESGVAVGFLFKELVARESKLAIIPLSSDERVSVSLVWKRGAYMSDSMRAFKDFVKEGGLLI